MELSYCVNLGSGLIERRDSLKQNKFESSLIGLGSFRCLTESQPYENSVHI